jgi:hypothetical protein
MIRRSVKAGPCLSPVCRKVLLSYYNPSLDMSMDLRTFGITRGMHVAYLEKIETWKGGLFPKHFAFCDAGKSGRSDAAEKQFRSFVEMGTAVIGFTLTAQTTSTNSAQTLRDRAQDVEKGERKYSRSKEVK